MAGSKLEGEEETVIPARVKLADIAEIASVSTAAGWTVDASATVTPRTRASICPAE